MCDTCFSGTFLSRKKERRPIISIMLIRIVRHIHSTKLLTFIYLESKHRVIQIEFSMEIMVVNLENCYWQQ